MHKVGHDVVEQPLIVCHHNRGVVGTLECVHPARDDAQGIDVESRVRLVENGQLGLEHRHLQDFVALFLAARKAGIHRTAHHRGVHLDELELLLHHIEKLHRVHFVHPLRAADFIVRSTQEVGVGHARNFHRILKGQKHAALRAHFGRHLEQVLAIVQHFTTGDLVRRVSGQHLRQRALARAIGAHDGMHFTGVHGERNALENGLAVNRGVKIVDLKHQSMECDGEMKKISRRSLRA
jgi:hypothetical protein